MYLGKQSLGKQSTALIVLLAAAATPAWAHHSFAMFDASKTLTMSGTVKDWQWTNPHSWIEVTVADKDGAAKQWSIELASPAMMARRGWTHRTLTAGDQITISIHPMKDGTFGGQLVSLTLPNGQVMGQGGPPGAGGGGGGRRGGPPAAD